MWAATCRFRLLGPGIENSPSLVSNTDVQYGTRKILLNKHVENTAQLTSWYLAQIKPNSFRIAERNLKQQGFNVFNPTQNETRKRTGRFVSVVRPLFPGYLFLSFDPKSAPWRAINSTYGVSRLVTLGQTAPKPLPSKLIAGLMLRCDEAGRLLPTTVLQPGDEVRVMSGPFADFVTKVESIAADQRIWVLLDIMGRDAKVAVSAEALQKVWRA
ncbi:transcriptional activator RfaH [bacterium AH-315-P15]|nr:transcriptional activator RfaH [bacterium AH-315-P15]